MTTGILCTFCDKPAKEWHHVAGDKHCRWFRVPLCIPHHLRITRAYRNTNPDMMKAASGVEERIRLARQGCLTFLWLLEHPEEIDPERILQ